MSYEEAAETAARYAQTIMDMQLARQIVADVYDAAMALYDAESAQDEVEARESKHFVLDGEWDKANKRVCDCIEVLRDACRRAREK